MNEIIVLGIEIVYTPVIAACPKSALLVLVQRKDGGMAQASHIVGYLYQAVLPGGGMPFIQAVERAEPDVPLIVFHKVAYLFAADPFRRVLQMRYFGDFSTAVHPVKAMHAGSDPQLTLRAFKDTVDVRTLQQMLLPERHAPVNDKQSIPCTYVNMISFNGKACDHRLSFQAESHFRFLASVLQME